jgi:hypothetical protein
MVPLGQTPEIPRLRDRRCPDPVGRGKGTYASDRRRVGRRRGRRPLSHPESDWLAPRSARKRATQSPPRSRGGRAAKTGDRRRRGWGSRGSPVVLGIRLDCRSHRAASGRKRPRESVERSGLAQCARARWCKKTSTAVFSSWPGGGAERPTRAGLRAGACRKLPETATGSSMGKGTPIRGSPPRWRVGGRKRKRRVARKRAARDRECQRSSVSSARGRQRRGEVVNHLPLGARPDGPKLLARRQPQRDPRRRRCKARTAVARGREALGRRGAAKAPPQGVGRIPCAREWSRLQKSMEASSSGPRRLTAQRSSE